MNSYSIKIALFAALMLGFAFGLATSRVSTGVQAEVRQGSPAQHVPSGAQQSVVELRKMATTLKSIDRRLARLEATAERIAKQKD